MVRKKISDFLLYRARYSIAFASLIVLLLVVLIFAGKFVPGGLSEAEMRSATASIHTPLLALNGDETSYLLHLPYHILQKLSVMLFGVQSFAIKLPSVILAFISIIALYGVLKLWFKRNTAILTSVIAVSSTQFLFLSQMGTPSISYIFWPAVLLFVTTMIAYSEKSTPVWIIAAAVAGALSLYTPLMIYILIALAATCLIHPHARFVVFKQAKAVLAVSVIIWISLIVPIIVGTIHTPTILANLFGFTSATFSLRDSLAYLMPYFELSNPSIGLIVTPIYSLVVLLLIVVGAIRLVTTKYTAKSYILSILFLFFLLGAVAGIVPTSFTFIPAMVLVAFAMSYIIRSWYELFPLNPYARVVGLLPLGVLLAGISLSEFNRYTYGMQYSQVSSTVFHKDVQLIRSTIQTDKSEFVLLTNTQLLQFYIDLAERTKTASGKPLIVTASAREARKQAPTHTIITSPARKSAISVPAKVLVSDTTEDSARFYLYKNEYK